MLEYFCRASRVLLVVHWIPAVSYPAQRADDAPDDSTQEHLHPLRAVRWDITVKLESSL